ncbi:MAG: cytochrome c553 [Oceanospirillaceae bacterium]|jgi:cytochrome c553
MTKINLPQAMLLPCWLGAISIAVLFNHSLHAEQNTEATPLHISQQLLNNILKTKGDFDAFDMAFKVGDELFEHQFLAAEGVGANVGNGQRFSLIPRADLNKDQQWANHTPKRVTGPNAQSCDVCHGTPFGDGAGKVVMNNIRDPKHSGDISQFINRQPPHIFGIGALQLLAQEMTTDLANIKQQALVQAQNSGQSVTLPLASKGINFGSLTAHSNQTLNTAAISGLDADLLIKPIEWKGITANIRAFVRDASHNELGMQATEITGDDVDGDGDGVVNELSVGDITAMVIYQAAQPRPTTNIELAKLGIIPALSQKMLNQIKQGETAFNKAACSACHQPSLTLNSAVFTEPSQHPLYRDSKFPAGQDPLQQGVNPNQPIRFDLTKDLPDNIITASDGSKTSFGNFETDDSGAAIVYLYGDLKRHDMGPALAEAIDEAGTGAATFLTKELWGVGSTAPYLHDGRATTLAEAIDFHGGESAASRKKHQALTKTEQNALIAFLNNLVLYKMAEE